MMHLLHLVGSLFFSTTHHMHADWVHEFASKSCINSTLASGLAASAYIYGAENGETIRLHLYTFNVSSQLLDIHPQVASRCQQIAALAVPDTHHVLKQDDETRYAAQAHKCTIRISCKANIASEST